MTAAGLQVAPAYRQGGTLRLSAEVCVVGSGAGGAVCAKELAEAGLDVVVLEQGDHVPASAYTARPLEMMKTLYAEIGMTAALGRPGVALPYGRCLGGTTVVNSGTCFRTPARVLSDWRRRLGLDLGGEAALAPLFERVEGVIHVAPGEPELLGGAAGKVMAGAGKLGLHARPLPRNARGCNGCGVCCFGCPTGAKQAMHVSYLPLASRAGARIYTGCRVDRVKLRGERVVGVTGRLVDPATLAATGELEVRAPVVILAAGALASPLVLLRSGLDEHGQVGRGLHLHPASKVTARFEEDVGWEGIPQSVYVDDFHDDGIMMEGVSMPPDVGSLALPLHGRRHLELMAGYRRLASFGAMIEDTGHGRVRRGLLGAPLVTYDLHRRDAARMQRALATIAEIFFAAGAREAFAPVHGHEHLRDLDDVERLRRAALRPTDFELVAFHPSGTCRMGVDPRQSVVDVHGQVHGVRGLLVADASVIPTPLGVNPQVTIMTLATRTAFFVRDERTTLLPL